MSDEIPKETAAQQIVLRPPMLTFHVGRFDVLVTNQCLFLVCQLHRWQWHERGIYIFLSQYDHFQIACTCYAACFEHIERLTDDEIVLSPLADNGAVVHQTA